MHYKKYSTNKENLQNCGVHFVASRDSKVERKRKEREVPRLCMGIVKTLEHESDGYTNCNWCSWHSHQRISKRTRGLWNNRTMEDSPNYSTVEIS